MEITKAMKICADRVRNTKCQRCLHFKDCLRKGAPVSNLGAYIAWLQLYALRALQFDMQWHIDSGIILEAHEPNAAKDDAYAIIRVYEKCEFKKLVCRVSVKEAIYDRDVLNDLVLNTYFKKRKVNL